MAEIEEQSDIEVLEELGFSVSESELLLSAGFPLYLARDWASRFPSDSAESMLEFFRIDPLGALGWRESMFSPEEVEAWRTANFSASAVFSSISAERAALFEQSGLNPTQAALWAEHCPLLSPEEICAECSSIRALDRTISPEMALAWRHASLPSQLAEWLASGFSPVEVAEMGELEVEAYDAKIWRDHFPEDSPQVVIDFLGRSSFDLDAALAWRSTGVDVQVAQEWFAFFPDTQGIAWLEAGFSPQAARMMDDLFRSVGSEGAFGSGDNQHLAMSVAWREVYPELSVADIDSIEEWCRHGFRDPEQVRPWVGIGLPAAKARTFMDAGCDDPQVALSWGELGFNAASVLTLLEHHSIEGWVSAPQFTEQTGRIPMRGFSGR